MSAGGEIVQQESKEMKVELTARVTVLAINAIGRPTQAKLVVEKSLVTIGTESRPILEPDTEVIVANKDKNDEFSVNGTPLSDEVAKMISVAF